MHLGVSNLTKNEAITVPNTILFVFLLAVPFDCAFAYVDPGVGMLLWQGAIAAIGALVIFFRKPFASIKSIINRFLKK